MIFKKLKIPGSYLIRPKPFFDNREFFRINFCKKEIKILIKNQKIV